MMDQLSEGHQSPRLRNRLFSEPSRIAAMHPPMCQQLLSVPSPSLPCHYPQ
uniref:Uncharacterized protein n=1 Tax=Anguilla anguilla TaxID=7936 RepID=A0A0E9VP55_ANGAN